MAQHMPTTNKELAIRLFVEVFDHHDLSAVDGLLGPGFVFHNAATDIHGPAGWKAFAAEWINGFSDLHVVVDFAIAEDDRVLLHWRAEGTHTGEFRGTPATGRRISASGLTLMRFSDGEIFEMWDETAAFGRLESLTVT